jgi:hypothetical protein
VTIDSGRVLTDQALVSDEAPAGLHPSGFDPSREETQEQRARRLFDEMARNIGREAVNHLKTMHPHMLSDKAQWSKIWELSLVNAIRNDINWRMRPLLMAMIAMHAEWEEEHSR